MRNAYRDRVTTEGRRGTLIRVANIQESYIVNTGIGRDAEVICEVIHVMGGKKYDKKNAGMIEYTTYY